MQHTITWIQKKESKKGPYLRIGLGDAGFFNCFDRPVPDVDKGDTIEVEEMDTAKALLRGVKKVGGGGPSGSPGGNDPTLFYVSYAKDILLSDLSPAKDPVDAANIAEILMERFGTERSGSMLAAYAKDLICAGWEPEKACDAILDMRANLQASYQFGDSE